MQLVLGEQTLATATAPMDKAGMADIEIEKLCNEPEGVLGVRSCGRTTILAAHVVTP
jgi:hypothetical protein